MVRAVTLELVQILGLELVLHETRTTSAHRTAVRGDGNLGRSSHETDLGAAFEQTHLVEQMVERDDLRRRMPAVTFHVEHIHPAEQALIELDGDTHRVVDALAAL